MKNRLVVPVVFLMFGAIALPASWVWAAEKPQQDVAGRIEALTERLEAQDQRISTLEGKLTDKALHAARTEEIAKIMSDMRTDARARTVRSHWMDNLKFFGDMRLRYDHSSEEGANGTDLKDRNRSRFRLRFGFIKTWLDDQMTVGFRLASGNNSSGTDTNQTLTGGFSKKNIWLDRVYARYSPKAIPGLTVIAGKMPNILEHTDLIYDSDLNLEGAGIAYHRELCRVDVFGNFAHLVVNEVHDGHDTILNVYQAGLRAPLPRGVKATVTASFHDFENAEDFPIGAPGGWNRNTKLFNILARADFQACGLPWRIYFDWVHNTQDNDQAADFENADDGYAVGVKVGKNKKRGDWSVGYKYKYIERNATPDGLTSGTFGGTNRKGHVVKAVYNLTDFLSFSARFWLVQPITGDGDQSNFIMRYALIWKFK